MTNNNSLVFDRNDMVTYGGMISGTGSLTQLGPGTLVLAGTNTHSGGTTIFEDTLQLGNGGTSGLIIGDVTDNGLLVFQSQQFDELRWRDFRFRIADAVFARIKPSRSWVTSTSCVRIDGLTLPSRGLRVRYIQATRTLFDSGMDLQVVPAG